MRMSVVYVTQDAQSAIALRAMIKRLKVLV
jgi:hypothetical protein